MLVSRVMTDVGGGAYILLCPELAHSASAGQGAPVNLSCEDQGISRPRAANAAGVESALPNNTNKNGGQITCGAPDRVHGNRSSSEKREAPVCIAGEHYTEMEFDMSPPDSIRVARLACLPNRDRLLFPYVLYSTPAVGPKKSLCRLM